VSLSPQENYTDWATANCQWNLVPTFAHRKVSHGQRGGSPTVVNFSFLDRSRYFSFQVAPHLSSRGWVDPVPDPQLLRISGSTGNRSKVLSRNSDHRTTEAVQTNYFRWKKLPHSITVSVSGHSMKNGVLLNMTSFGCCKKQLFGGTYRPYRQSDTNKRGKNISTAKQLASVASYSY
jgi:hypothetical protein